MAELSVTLFAGDLPPPTNPDVEVPKPPCCLVIAGILLTSVHADPFQDSTASVFTDGPSPPATIPAVVVPNPEPLILAVFNSAISVHYVPSYCSTLLVPGEPPA